MIGLLGGTFDPVHLGHLRPALETLQALGLDELRFVPLNVAVHRPQPQAPAAVRLAMLEASVGGQPGFRVDTRELDRPGGSFSYDTLVSLRAELGGSVPIGLLVGADAFQGFLDWYRPREILGLAHLVVMRRPGASGPLSPALQALYDDHACLDREGLRRHCGGLIWFQDVTQVDIASTRVRALIRRGLSPRYLVPEPVLRIIEETGVYR